MSYIQALIKLNQQTGRCTIVISEASDAYIYEQAPRVRSHTFKYLLLPSVLAHIAVLTFYGAYKVVMPQAQPLVVELQLSSETKGQTEKVADIPNSDVKSTLNNTQQNKSAAQQTIKAKEQRSSPSASATPTTEINSPATSLKDNALRAFIGNKANKGRAAAGHRKPCTPRQLRSALFDCDQQRQGQVAVKDSQYTGTLGGLLDKPTVLSQYTADMRAIAKLSVVQDALYQTMQGNNINVNARSNVKDKHLQQEYFKLSNDIAYRLKKYDSMNLLKVVNSASKIVREKVAERK